MTLRCLHQTYTGCGSISCAECTALHALILLLARRLFEMGFAEQLRAILGAMSESRQTLLFSATLPAALAEFARAGLRDPELVRLDVESKLSPDLGLAFFTVR